MTAHLLKDSTKNRKQIAIKGGNSSSVAVISSIRSARRRATNTKKHKTVAELPLSVNPVGSGGVGRGMLFTKR